MPESDLVMCTPSNSTVIDSTLQEQVYKLSTYAQQQASVLPTAHPLPLLHSQGSNIWVWFARDAMDWVWFFAFLLVGLRALAHKDPPSGLAEPTPRNGGGGPSTFSGAGRAASTYRQSRDGGGGGGGGGGGPAPASLTLAAVAAAPPSGGAAIASAGPSTGDVGLLGSVDAGGGGGGGGGGSAGGGSDAEAGVDGSVPWVDRVFKYPRPAVRRYCTFLLLVRSLRVIGTLAGGLGNRDSPYLCFLGAAYFIGTV